MTDNEIIISLFIIMYIIPLVLCITVIINDFDYDVFINIKYEDNYRLKLKRGIILDLILSFAPIINLILSIGIIGHYYDKLKDKYD